MITVINPALLTDMEFLESLEDAKARLEGYQELVGRMEMEGLRRMEARGATSIPNANADGEQIYVCKRVETWDYSQESFAPLREIFSTADLNPCYTPEHQEVKTVPGKWHTQQVKAVAKKYGTEALDIVEKAKTLGSIKLRFYRVLREVVNDE